MTPTRILIVGSGGREHALAWKLAAEPGVNEVVVAPGSAGIATESRVRVVGGLDPLDPAAVVAAARAVSAELVVIGPEAPLAAGVADALRAAGIRVFGPDRAAARIETSKAFCHEIAAAAGVRMARAASFGAHEAAAAAAYVAELGAGGRGIVLKADGLAAGKGVTVFDDVETALAALPGFLSAGAAPSTVGPRDAGPGGGLADGAPVLVVEERLTGREVSVIAVCDGRMAVALPAARDHKRLGDGDSGPNTGGMGAYSPVPDLPDDAVDTIIATVHRPILAELARRGTPFIGFLYAGLMLTPDGPALLECNARLGDPEAQVILPRLGVALGPILLAAARGSLASAPAATIAGARLPAIPGAAVGIVLAAGGYPGTPERGAPIAGLAKAHDRAALLFHAGTAASQEGGWTTNGGRVLAVVGRGLDLAAARAAAEHAADAVAWPGMQRRRDIAAELPAATEPAAAGSAAGSPLPTGAAS